MLATLWKDRLTLYPDKIFVHFHVLTCPSCTMMILPYPLTYLPLLYLFTPKYENQEDF